MKHASPADDPRIGERQILDRLAQMEKYIAAREPSVRALIPQQARFERLRLEAEALTAPSSNHAKRPSLLGALVGVKDIFRVDGMPTQAGSRVPGSEFLGEQAKTVTQLKNAGALVLGKTVTTEFAYFTPGPTRNPHNPDHTPGGSSSGSAAAVAAGFCDLALGTQTIGSIIRPASFCGVIGFKPTYDRVSRSEVIPLSPSLDHVGLFASNLGIAIRAANALISDWRTWDSEERPVLGIPVGPYMDAVSPEGRQHFEHVCQVLGSHYSIRHVAVMSDFPEVRSRHDLILSAEAAQVHAEWFEKYEPLYSSEFAGLIRRGRSIKESQLQSALDARREFRSSLMKLMHDHGIDLWIAPSAVGSAPKGLDSTGDPIMNLPWTQAGLPAMNLPSGRSKNGLPLGLQLVASWNMDEALLYWGAGIEKAIGLP